VSPTAFGDAGLFGGGERYPVELARALARLDGVQCGLVTFGRSARSDDVDGLRVRVLRARGHLRHHPAHPLGRVPVAEIRRADVLHVHHLHSSASRLAVMTATAFGTTRVATDHGLAGRDRWGLGRRAIDGFLPVSGYAAEVMGSPARRTAVIYGGADPARFHPDTGPRDGVLYVGRLTPHKGVDRLIRALPDSASLTVAGTGGHDREPPERDYADHLRRLAKGKDVRFLGAVPDLDLPLLYRRAAVVAVPSVHRTCYGKHVAVAELLGLTTLEAMASGTPVVASAAGGIAEIVIDGVTGYLVTPGDVDELRGRLEQVLHDTRAARTLGDAARDRVLDGLTWDACAQRCLAAYEALRRSKRDIRRMPSETPTPER
jgi:glycosyltransferase involved in cell wall biosynthesis